MALGWALTLSGCASKFPAYPVDLTQTDPALGGIYYALPKTLIDIEIPVDRVAYVGGELARLQDCIDGIPAGEDGDPCLPTAIAVQWRFRPARIEGRPTPDERHVYRVTPQARWWLTQSHGFSNSELGYLEKVEASGTNEAVPIIAAVVKALISSSAAGFGLLSTDTGLDAACKAFDSDPKKAPAKVIVAVQRLVEQQPAQALYRPQAECIGRVIETAQSALDNAMAEQLKSLDPSDFRDMPESFITEVIAQRARTVDMRRKQLSDLRIALRVDATEKSTSFTVAPFESLEPEVADQRPVEPVLLMTSTKRDPRYRLKVAAGQTVNDLPAREEEFGEQFGLCARIRAASATRVDKSWYAPVANETAAALGYRYRLAAQAQVLVQLIKRPGSCYASDGVVENAVVLGSAVLPVAQFGPVVALPVQFQGREVKVEMSLGPTGAMRNIVLGQKAIDPSAVTGAIDALAARKDARTEAAKKAPLDQATQQADVLAQQIKAQLAQRCLDQLRSLPPGAALPAECEK